MRSVSRLVTFIALSITVGVGSASSQGRCPAGDSGCTVDNAGTYIQDRVNQGFQDVQEADSISERVDEVQNTLQDCLECGMDAVTSGMDQITGLENQ